MPTTKIDSGDFTNNYTTDFDNTIQGKVSTDDFSCRVDEATAENINEYIPDWNKWKGYYNVVAALQSVIDKKAIWTIGKGFEADKKTKNRLDEVNGFGKDTFNSIMSNTVRVYTVGGDSFAEKTGGKSFISGLVRTKWKNLKPLNPGTIKILGTNGGRLRGYEQWLNGKKVHTFKPDELFHLSWNRLADAIHGIGTVEKIEDIILMHREAMQDMKTVFHRYVKPLIVMSVDTDDDAEISKFKEKLRKTMELSENLILPKGTVDKIEHISIPQYSTLDPLPWIQLLERQFLTAEGVPGVILGEGKETTEATSKILYLAFQQMIEWNQLFLEEQIKTQLGMEVNFKFPASIAPDLIAGEAKAKKTNNHEVGTGQNTGG